MKGELKMLNSSDIKKENEENPMIRVVLACNRLNKEMEADIKTSGYVVATVLQLTSEENRSTDLSVEKAFAGIVIDSQGKIIKNRFGRITKS